MKKNLLKVSLTSCFLASSLCLPASAGAAENTVIHNKSKQIQMNSSSAKTVIKSADNSNWKYAKTFKGSTKFQDTSFKYVVIGLSGVIGYAVAGPLAAGLTPIASQIITDNIKTVYVIDKQYFRMAGATLQVKHVYTAYKDSKYTKKIKTVEFITNDMGGAK